MLPKAFLRTAVSIACGAAVLLLSACPPPIDLVVSDRLTDKTPPVVTVGAPGNNTAYTQTVTVQGIQNKPGKLKSLAYTVSGTLGVLTTGTVDLALIGTDGSFSFQFSTLTFSGPIAVTVTATDWNDNVGQATVTLTSPGSYISSFTVTPASKSATLSWEPISGATYTVYYTTNGTVPTQNYGSTATPSAPPYVISGLKNGALCTFLLRAHMTGGTDYWSGYTQAIPLSPLTLAPMVSGDYRQIKLEWSAIDGATQFVVSRDTDPAGTFPAYSGVVAGTTFTDTNVADNTWYYYKVRPTLVGSVTSTYNAAQTFLYSPSAASAITNVVLSMPGNRLKVSGNYAFAAAGTQLWIIDVSNPKTPFLAGTLGGFTNAQDIVLYSSYAYVADGSGGVRVVSLASPLSPSIVATVTATNAVGLSIAGTYLFVLDGTTVVRAFGLGNPAAPVAGGTTSGTTWADVAATVTGGITYVYVGTSNGASSAVLRYTYSGSVFAGPASVSTGSLGYLANLISVAPTTTTSDYLYIVGNATSFLEPPPPYELMVVSLSSFTVVGQTATSLKGYMKDVTAIGTKVYVVDGAGLQLIDVSTPTAPVAKQFWDNPGSTTGVALTATGSYAVMTTVLGFQTVDLNLPTSFPTDKQLPIAGGGATSGAVRGSYAFILAAAAPTFRAANVSDPANPLIVGSTALPVGAVAVALSGPYAFVAASSLAVADISNPASPAVIGSAATLSGSGNAIAVKGDYVYLATTTGLQIFDVSDPTHPAGVGLFDSDGGGIQAVVLRGSNAYINDGAFFQPTSLKILDVSDPAAPTLVTAVTNTAMIVEKLALYGDWAFYADSGPGTGLFAVNINPSSVNYLVKKGPCATKSGGGNSMGVCAFGRYAYVADSAAGAGIAVVDVADPTTLSNSSLLNTRILTSAKDLVVSGKYAYVSDSGGLDIIALY